MAVLQLPITSAQLKPSLPKNADILEVFVLEPDSTRERVCTLLASKKEFTIKDLYEAYLSKNPKVSYVSIIKAIAPLVEKEFVERRQENTREAKVSIISLGRNVQMSSGSKEDISALALGTEVINLHDSPPQGMSPYDAWKKMGTMYKSMTKFGPRVSALFKLKL